MHSDIMVCSRNMYGLGHNWLQMVCILTNQFWFDAGMFYESGVVVLWPDMLLRHIYG